MKNTTKTPWNIGTHNKPTPVDVSTINQIYNEYHNNPAQYQNHSAYECLKMYSNPFDWRPGQLILISSDTERIMQLDDPVVLTFVNEYTGPTAPAHILCGSEEMGAECGSLNSFNSENLATLVYRDIKIDYALYKAKDSDQLKIRTCHLKGSPQVLMGIYWF